MRILLFIPDLKGGGAERSFLNLAPQFVKQGFSVSLLLMRREGSYVASIPSGIDVHSLDRSRMLNSLPSLIRSLRRLKPDVILSTLVQANVSLMLATVFLRSKPKLFLRVETVMSSARRVYAARMSMKAAFLLVPILYRRADGLIAISRGVKEDLVSSYRIPPEKIHVIFNPVLDEDFEARSVAKLDFDWFSNKTKPVVLAVGRLERDKNFGALLEAFAIVSKHIDARLVILGEGSERRWLESVVRSLGLHEKVSLPGFVDNPCAFMSRSDLLVNVSLFEGFGNVLVEALACGAPVISFDCPHGPSEILDGGRLGRLVPPNDIAGLAEAIRHSLEHGGRHAREAELDKFRARNVAREYAEVLNGCEPYE